jgi:hypothetical protein
MNIVPRMERTKTTLLHNPQRCEQERTKLD